MAVNVDPAAIESVGRILQNPDRSLAERFRALFTLRNIGGHMVIEAIARCFEDPSALLKHECAYCLGQMQDKAAIPYLVQVLEDRKQEPMVRHEAGEALGAIGAVEVLELLTNYSSDPVIEVAETCQLAVARIQWLHGQERLQEKTLPENPYLSVDPAPPCVLADLQTLRDNLLDESVPLFQRYRAMFALRNKGDAESVLALGAGLKSNSALFRHEIAYVLGQMQHPAAIEQLKVNLVDEQENSMVRHECAEALGAIANEECLQTLREHLQDNERVVKESCEIAVDMCEYETSEQFQYADGLCHVNSKINLEKQKGH